MTFRPAADIARVALLMLLLVPFEEVGWRGCALPLLEKRFRPFVASLILAGIWALWHLPLAWASVGFQRSDQPWRYMLWFTISIVPITLLATWLFHRTGESVILVSLLHIAVNLADFVLVLPSRQGETALLVTSAVTLLVVAAVWRRIR